MIKCAYCDKEITDTDYKIYKKRKYHPLCYQRYVSIVEKDNKKKTELIQSQQYNHLLKYICRLFDFKEDNIPPIIYKQLDEYLESGRYTISGIHCTLRYFYGILEKPVTIKTLGIVPFVYQQSYEYYINMKETNERNKQATKLTPTVKLKIVPPDRRIKSDIDFKDL